MDNAPLLDTTTYVDCWAKRARKPRSGPVPWSIALEHGSKLVKNVYQIAKRQGYCLTVVSIQSSTILSSGTGRGRVKNPKNFPG